MNSARAYVLESRFEFVKLWRLPAYVIPTLAFPLMFYVFFGLVMGSTQHVGSTSIAAYLLASYGTFGVVGASLFAFGVGVAVERGQGWLSVKRASPMPPLAYFVAKLTTSVAFGGLIVLLLIALGEIFGNVRLDVPAAIRLVATLTLGAIPFCALGLVVGTLALPNSAPAIVNVIYLPMSFLSGLWIPIEMLPANVQHIAIYLPAYHLGQLALGAIGLGHGDTALHVAYLAAFTLVTLGAAVYGFRRDEGRTYG